MSGGTVTVNSSAKPPSTTSNTVPPSFKGADKTVFLPPIQEGKDEAMNPFIMPPDRELFTLRERERQKMKEERSKDRLLKVHEKGTYRSRMNSKLSALRKAIAPKSEEEDEDTDGLEKASRIHKQTQFALATTRDRRIEKEDLTSYIEKKREMFLLQYSLGVKRDEIQKLEEIARTEEKKLESAEKYLEQSATMFDEFLKENDKNSVEAIKMAEAATKAKLEKVAEIKRLNAQIVTLKSEISRNEDILNELKTYREFLNELAPEEWHIKMEEKRKRPVIIATDDDEDTLEQEELYFTEPTQLLEMFTELEEQNLSLIQNGQETEETLEEMKHNRQYTEQKMKNELDVLKKQVDILERNIDKEEQKGYDLEMKSKMYLFGEFKAEDQEEMLHALDKKVADVYNRCIGSGNEATVNTLQMLAAIEGRMEELFEELESLPVEKVEAAEKAKEKERRLRLREQKLVEQRQHQEERLKRALERSQADPKKRGGRKLVYRSEPPVLKRRTKDSDDMKEREEEELQYFFS